MGVVKFESAHSGRRSRGSAIVLAVLIVIMLTVSGMVLLSLSYFSSLRAIRKGEETACRVLTDAGFTKAIVTLNAQYKSGTLNNNALPISVGETMRCMKGTFSYRVTQDANNEYIITSVGEQGNFLRIEVAKLKLQAESYFDNAILTKGGTNLGGTAYAYNPDDPNAPIGTYPLTLGSLDTKNPSVVLNGTVYGDAFCAVGEDPNALISGIDNVTGSAYALTNAPTIVQPVMPTGLPSYGPYTINGGTTTFTPSDSGIYDNFAVSGKGALVIDGGTVTIGINNLLQLGTSCEIVVNEGSTLLLYIEDGISSMNGSSISYNSETIDPAHIQIYGTGTGDCTFALKSKEAFQGVIYAPNAFVSIQTASKIIGAVVADGFSGGPGIEFVYDTSLATADLALGESRYEVDRWSESTTCEIPGWAQ